ncbi:MAG TPA: SagB/ThcOx family dehydrogenase [Paludibacter sp.]|nr:SagB/ThcOx family dehydrogenase [Paludibacter sp.]HOS44945.1 SagB/ThcOx family dehydrogenase [Paludibacter sp.]HPM09073.1 SagB/ThcOx family dehydrogenase [Paludibacter sp.]
MKTKILSIILISIGYCSMNAQEIKLPAPDRSGGQPLMKSLNERKSTRSFSEKDLSDQQLSNLLWAANGFNREDKRTAPTAMDRQELELYVISKKGVYFYNAKEHKLTLVKGGDHRKSAGLQDYVYDAPLNIMIVADMDKAASQQYSYTNCGYISQNIYLYCASEGLATVARGSFDKEELYGLLQLSKSQEVLLAQTVGFPK